MNLSSLGHLFESGKPDIIFAKFTICSACSPKYYGYNIVYNEVNNDKDDQEASPRPDYLTPSMARLSGLARSVTQGRFSMAPTNRRSIRIDEQDQGQSMPQSVEDEPDGDQGHIQCQDEDQNDEEIPPRNNKEIEAHRRARLDRILELISHT